MRSCLTCLFFCWLVVPGLAQAPRDHRAEALMLKKVLVQEHFQPKTVNDNFSQDVFKFFLETLDPDKLYFTEAELAPLRKYSTLIDDELNGTGWNFLNQLKPVYKNALTRARTTIDQLAQT